MRVALGLIWVPTLISYILRHRFGIVAIEANSADTFLVALTAYAGVALAASECVRTKEEVLVLVRTAVWAAAFSAFVAILQFRPGFDLTDIIGRIPLLTPNGSFGDVSGRGGFNRPPGTTIHPIEFSVVTATALAFAIYLLLYDLARPKWKRQATFFLIALAIPIAISRSALVVAFVVIVYFLAGATRVVRVKAAAFFATFGLMIFVLIPGLLGTLKGLVLAGQSDSSIATRTSDYAIVARYVRPNPWFGRGGGTFLPSYRILDNQLLLTLVEIGIFGVASLIVLFLTSSCLGRAARRHVRSEGDQMLSQMFAAAGMGSFVALATFDALSFPTFTAYSSLWLGLSGGWWTAVVAERRRDGATPQVRSAEMSVSSVSRATRRGSG